MWNWYFKILFLLTTEWILMQRKDLGFSCRWSWVAIFVSVVQIFNLDHSDINRDKDLLITCFTQHPEISWVNECDLSFILHVSCLTNHSHNSYVGSCGNLVLMQTSSGANTPCGAGYILFWYSDIFCNLALQKIFYHLSLSFFPLLLSTGWFLVVRD